MKQDLEVWMCFLMSFNGIAFWQDELCLEAELQVHLNMAGSSGLKIFNRGHWCAETWPPV